MSLPITDLFSPSSADQFRASMVANLVTLGVPADQWRKGGVASTILTIVSMALAIASSVIASLVQGFFLPYASGTGLKFLAFYVYGVTAPEATFATGKVTLTNTGGGVYTQAAGSITLLDTATKQTYTNDAALVIGALSTVTNVAITCTTAGTVGNANPGAVDALVTTLLGVTVTNPASVVGADAISDPLLRQLCLNSLGIRSVRGPRTAYAYAIQTALNPITGSPVNVSRWSITAASHTGTVTIYLASPSGAPSSDDITGVENNIEALARPDAVTVNVFGATEVPYTAAIVVWCTAPTNTTQAQLTTAAENAITAYLAAYSIGGVVAGDDANPSFTGLLGGGIAGAVATAFTAIGATLVSFSGATDLALTAGQVATDSTTLVVRILTVPGSTTTI